MVGGLGCLVGIVNRNSHVCVTSSASMAGGINNADKAAKNNNQRKIILEKKNVRRKAQYGVMCNSHREKLAACNALRSCWCGSRKAAGWQ